MSRWTDRSLVGVYLLVAIAPAIGIATRFDNAKINGALSPAKRPAPSFHRFLDEKYQADLTAWFESNLGFRAYSVHADNTLLYHVFGESKQGARVKVGGHGVLYELDDLAYYSKTDPYLPSAETVDAYAAKLAKVQTWVAGMRRGFVPVIIPSKTTIWRDDVPAAWARPLGAVRPTDTRVYEAFKRALDAHGVVYVDARAMLEHSTEPRARLWGHDARHWSAYAACLTMQAVMAKYAQLTHRPPVDYPCPVTMRSDVPDDFVDFDLWGLLNAWAVPRDPVVPVVAAPAAAPAGARPNALIVGCSFSWTLLRDAERSRALGALYMNYYNKTFVAWPQDVHTPVEPGSAAWNDITLREDLYILDLTETYLFADGAYSTEFVDQLGEALLP